MFLFTKRCRTAAGRLAADSGFSLLELLVVVAIIAILLGVSTAVLAGMKQKARTAVSRDTAKQLAEAWTRYLQTHGEWPAEIANATESTKFTADGNLLKLLNSGTTFLDTKKGEVSGGVKDSWGNVFVLWFDTDYNGQLEHPFESKVMVRATVVVASPGPDGKFGTSAKPSRDDIVVY